MQSRIKKGQMTHEKFEKTLSLLKGVLDYEGFRDVDMVIEVLQITSGFVVLIFLLRTCLGKPFANAFLGKHASGPKHILACLDKFLKTL